MTHEQIVHAKNTSRCKRCGNFGHWFGGHDDDGSLPANIANSSTPIHNDKSKSRMEDYRSDDNSTSMPRALKFNNAATLVTQSPSSLISPQTSTGTLVNAGTPYPAIGIVEISVAAVAVLTDWNGTLESRPDAVADCDYWQYSVGEHASEPRKIIGSILIPCRADNNALIWIRHLVLDDSSQWVVGQNVTCHGNICQIGQPRLLLRDDVADNIQLSLIKRSRLLYFPTSSYGLEDQLATPSLKTASVSAVKP